MTIVYALLIALFGLLAAWTKNVDEKPASHRWTHRIPVVGHHLSRLRWRAYFFAFSILFFTGLSIWANNQDQAEIKSYLQALQKATSDLTALASAQDKALNTSIDRLATVKQQVDAVAKQGESLEQISASTSKTLSEGNRSLAAAQNNLAESIHNGNVEITGAQKELSSTLTKITSQMDAQYRDSLSKQMEAIGKIKDASKSIDSIRATLANFIFDEIFTQTRLATINAQYNEAVHDIDLQLSYVDKGYNSNIHHIIGMWKPLFDVNLAALKTMGVVGIQNDADRFIQALNSLPDNDWPISSKDHQYILVVANELKATLKSQCDFAAAKIQGNRQYLLKKETPTTVPAATSQP